MSTPVKPLHKKGTITKKKMISPTITHLTIKTEETLPTFKAGQYCTITLEKNGEQLKRPYSIASAPWEQDITLCIKKISEGKMSDPLVDSKEGTTVDVFSPLGKFSLSEQHDKDNYLFVGVGTGIAPCRSMIRTLFEKHYHGKGALTNKQVTLLFGTRNQKEAVYKEEFEGLAEKHKNFHYHITLSREDIDEALQGYVQHHIKDILTAPEKTNVFICGLKDMVIAVKEACQEVGVPKQHIHEELY